MRSAFHFNTRNMAVYATERGVCTRDSNANKSWIRNVTVKFESRVSPVQTQLKKLILPAGKRKESYRQDMVSRMERDRKYR